MTEAKTTPPANSGAVSRLYQSELERRGFTADDAQLAAVAALDLCAAEWAKYKNKRSNALKRLFTRPPIPRGVYMYGGVGRGKSFLMECFFEAVPIQRKTRLHFHEFMRSVQQELVALQGTANPLDALGHRVAQRWQLICFDEFHVADITSAMILHRLLDSLLRHGVGFVTTSNFHPDGLYPDGLHRDRILPAIALLKERLNIINVDNGTDYRQRTLSQARLYLTPCSGQTDAIMTALFEQLTEMPDEEPVLRLQSRTIAARRRAGSVVWFSFRELCDAPCSQNDYLEIANCFHTVMLSDVPRMAPAMAAAARRFTLLVDVLYDRRVKLVMSADVPADQLYTAGALSHEFVRTVSRLEEMRSGEYLALERRMVDTSLT